MADVPEIRVGQVWRDLDPRGGPTFRIVEVHHTYPQQVTVTDLTGKRRRRILTHRFRAHDGYRSGYALVPDPLGGDG